MLPASPTRQTIAQGKFLQLVSDNGWEYVERVRASGVVAVMAVTANRELVLTEQYRAPVQRAVIDLPAGLSGDITGQEAEAHVEAAQRELLEETGFEAESWKAIYSAPSSPGLTSEIVDYFQASNARRTSTGGGVDGEQIVTHIIPLRTIRRWLRSRISDGMYVDPKVYVALAFLRRFPDPETRRVSEGSGVRGTVRDRSRRAHRAMPMSGSPWPHASLRSAPR